MKAAVCLFSAIVLCSLLAFAPPAGAQSQASSGVITGVITDQGGAVVPNAEVVITNRETGVVRRVRTDERGRYEAPLLAVGLYTVEVKLAGFATTRAENVEVTIASTVDVNLTLRVSSVTETVTVTGSAPLVESTSPVSKSTVGELQIKSLPLVERNFASLILLTPGALISSIRNNQSIGGGKGINTAFNVDGADRTNPFFGGQVGGDRPPFVVSEDAIKEFVVISNGYNAEFGRSQGGLVNVVTKSGANDFHGDAFYFLQDARFVHDDVFGNPPLGRRQQFGGAGSGRLVRDKLFFFGATDNQQRGFPLNLRFNSLPALMAAANGPDPAPKAAAQAILAEQGQFTHTDNLRSALGRADWYINSRHNMSVRYSWHRSEQQNGTNSGLIEARSIANNGLEKDRNHNVVGQWNWLVSNLSVNEFRYQYSFEDRPRLNNPVTGAGTANGVSDGATVNITGVGFLGAVFFLPIPENDNRNQFTDNFSYRFGRHDIKVGVDYNRTGVAEVFRGNARGVYGFNNFDDFAAQRPASFTQFFGSGEMSVAVHEAALFAQEAFNVNRKVTLSYGLRWEGEFNPSSDGPPNADFPQGTSKFPDDTHMFAPRAGLAIDPGGNSRMVIRASAGYFYARTPALLFFNTFHNNGDIRNGVTFFTTDPSKIPPLSNSPAGPYKTPFDSFPGTVTQTQGTPPFGNVNLTDPSFKNSKTFRTTVGVERELTHDLSFSVNYNYANSFHLQRLHNRNLFPPTFNQAAGRAVYDRTLRPVQAVNQIVVVESSAKSHYNSVTFALNKRFSRRYQLQGHYTYANNMSDDDNERDANTQNGTDPNNFKQDFGRSLLDVRHNAVINGVVELPLGLQVSAILAARSGSPLNTTTGSDTVPASDAAALAAVNPVALATFRQLIGRPNAVVKGGGNNDGLFNDRPIVDGSLLPRFFLNDVKFVQFDMRITKSFTFRERHKALIYVNLFNLFNVANTQVGTTALNNSGYGVPNRLAGGPLSMSLGFRYEF